MTRERVVRRLAAILAADVVGYSRLMSRDENGTLARLKAHRTERLEPTLARHGGRLVKLIGDGALIEFPSAVDALGAAIEFQQAMSEANRDEVEDIRIVFRIGLHLGDLIVDGGDLYGDGVNVAARLEAKAPAGGIVLSGDVYNAVTGRLKATFDDLGMLSLKNIDRPVQGFGVTWEPADWNSLIPITVAPSIATTSTADVPLTLPAKPSIAVLPFQNMSGDPEQEYFADGISEDLMTGLARIRWLFVIARNSSFAFKTKTLEVEKVGRQLGVRYILVGSVRKAANRVRITSQLIDAETGTHLWAERYDRELVDIFELQDEITQQVVAAIEPTLRRAEIERVKRKRPDHLDAYDLYLRAVAHMYEVRPESRAAALDFVGRALNIAPDYAEAHGVAAWCYFARSLWEGSLPESFNDAMLRHARAVQELQTEDASTLAHAAIALALSSRDYDAALDMIDRAIAINPSSTHAYGHGSVINTWAGNYDKSIVQSEWALRLSPFDPLSVMPLAGQAGARLMKGEFLEAYYCARRGLQVYPTHTPSFLLAIICLVRLGRLDEAKVTARQFLEVSPTYRIVPHAPVFECFVTELRSAGVPG